ncbi:MAG: DNA recombination/repair protein RecA, partial [Planctomycetes bacterium]|nr:DNA recombination/repair protein RecA [Planctomycetota bacterium]
MAKAAARKPAANPQQQAIQDALAHVEKAFGKGALMRLGDKPRTTIKGISTGVLSVDLALGGAGVPRGRIVEIYGP